MIAKEGHIKSLNREKLFCPACREALKPCIIYDELDGLYRIARICSCTASDWEEVSHEEKKDDLFYLGHRPRRKGLTREDLVQLGIDPGMIDSYEEV